jgi:hypothetical protein
MRGWERNLNSIGHSMNEKSEISNESELFSKRIAIYECSARDQISFLNDN